MDVNEATALRENISVGDLVTIRKRNKAEVTKVTHVTPKQFAAGQYQFWKKDGRSLQTLVGGFRAYANPARPDEIRQYQEAKEQQQLASALSVILDEDALKIPLEVLRQWYNTAKAFVEE